MVNVVVRIGKWMGTRQVKTNTQQQLDELYEVLYLMNSNSTPPRPVESSGSSPIKAVDQIKGITCARLLNSLLDYID